MTDIDVSYLRADLGEVASDMLTLIAQHGHDIEYITRVVCPCASPSKTAGTGTAIPSCRSCDGTGLAFLWNQKRSVRALISSADTRQQLTPATPLTQGNLRVTLPPDVMPAEGDLIRLSNFFQTTDLLREYKKSTGGLRLPFDLIDAQTLTTYDPVAERLVILARGKDFTVDADRNLIIFPEESWVSDGCRISGRYTFRPYYLVERIPTVSRQQYTVEGENAPAEEVVEFPKTIMAARADGLHGRIAREVVWHGNAQRKADERERAFER